MHGCAGREIGCREGPASSGASLVHASPRAPALTAPQKTTLSIIVAVSVCHCINDVMQSLLTAIYPILKENYGLDFVQIGLLTFTFQVTASLLQPAIGMYHRQAAAALFAAGRHGLDPDRAHRPRLCPELRPAAARLGAASGIGSAIFHPESSRVARLASGGRHGLAQSLFQVGGNIGLGDRTAARGVHRPAARPGQRQLVRARRRWSASSSCGGWAPGTPAHHRANAGKAPVSTVLPFDRRTTLIALVVLTVLTLTKNAYMASLSSYYTFYLIHKFGVAVQDSQLLLFVFLGASAVGVFIGGPLERPVRRQVRDLVLDPRRAAVHPRPALCRPHLDGGPHRSSSG